MKRVFAGCMVLVLMTGSLAWGDIPNIISFQGVLKNGGGELLSGNFKLTFRIYDQATGGIPLWVEEINSVPVSQGVFNVNLGKNQSLGSVPFDRPYWVSVEANDGGELRPRMELASAPYSFSTQQILSQRILSSLLPVGTLLSSMLPPDQFAQITGGGWVEADGREISVNTEYAKLTNSVRIPDLRGKFLRGMEEGREAGSEQNEETSRITNIERRHTGHPNGGANGISVPTSGWSSWVTTGDGSAYENGLRFLIQGETRPVNIAVYYYIKID